MIRKIFFWTSEYKHLKCSEYKIWSKRNLSKLKSLYVIPKPNPPNHHESRRFLFSKVDKQLLPHTSLKSPPTINGTSEFIALDINNDWFDLIPLACCNFE